jgi:hypothetical protein
MIAKSTAKARDLLTGCVCLQVFMLHRHPEFDAFRLWLAFTIQKRSDSTGSLPAQANETGGGVAGFSAFVSATIDASAITE